MNPNTHRKVLTILACIATFSLTACAGLPGLGGTSWKEEVLLHDGRKIIVERTLERGGRHEIGQRSGATKETLAFTMPGTNQTITWNDLYSEDIGSSNFNLLMLEIANGSAYLVASPMGCLSYNKWGRPNPPYVVFNYQGTAWSRIPLAELPAELTAPNLVISSPDNAAEKASGGVVSVETIKQLNGRARRAESKTIVREALPESRLCPDWSSQRYRSPTPPLPIKPIGEKQKDAKKTGSGLALTHGCCGQPEKTAKTVNRRSINLAEKVPLTIASLIWVGWRHE